jgi:hypothetical protein
VRSLTPTSDDIPIEATLLTEGAARRIELVRV